MPKRKTTEQFIKEANVVHKGKYTYENVVYVRNNVKVDITCPIHGNFPQTPANHLSGHGCPECRADFLRTNRLKESAVYFQQASVVHHNKYDYSISQYDGQCKPLRAICPIHGEFVVATAKSHLLGFGCPICGNEQQLPI